jgi:tRNA-2-methylthio-N6-dimethylallyladenosine synthase
VEGPSSKDPSVFQGRTKNNRIVFFPGDARLEGQLVRVKITDARPWTLRGEVLAAVEA